MMGPSAVSNGLLLLKIVEDSNGPNHYTEKFSGFKWTNQHLF